MSEERRRLNLPDRRVNTYEALEERLDTHVAAIDKRFHKRYRGMLIAFSIIGITSAIAIAGYGIVLANLQDVRADFVRNLCEATNQRHDNASDALNKAAAADIEKAKAGQPNSQSTKSVKEIENRRDVTLGLIDLMLPKDDCDYQVNLALGKVSPTPVPTPKAP